MKPLIIACAEGYEKLVDLLLENNADVNILDHVGVLLIAPSIRSFMDTLYPPGC